MEDIQDPYNRISALNGKHYNIIEFFRDKMALRKIPPLIEHPYNTLLSQDTPYKLYKPPKTIIKKYGLYFSPFFIDVFDFKKLSLVKNREYIIVPVKLLILIVVTIWQIV